MSVPNIKTEFPDADFLQATAFLLSDVMLAMAKRWNFKNIEGETQPLPSSKMGLKKNRKKYRFKGLL